MPGPPRRAGRRRRRRRSLRPLPPAADPARGLRPPSGAASGVANPAPRHGRCRMAGRGRRRRRRRRAPSERTPSRNGSYRAAAAARCPSREPSAPRARTRVRPAPADRKMPAARLRRHPATVTAAFAPCAPSDDVIVDPGNGHVWTPTAGEVDRVRVRGARSRAQARTRSSEAQDCFLIEWTPTARNHD